MIVLAVRLVLTLLVLVATLSLLPSWNEPAGAQTSECWPEMRRVNESMEDLRRVRALEEEQTKLLRELVQLQRRRQP